jgi:hypothetical protein
LPGCGTATDRHSFLKGRLAMAVVDKQAK